MGDFSTSWLRLREPADRRSRDTHVASALRSAFAGRSRVSVVDLGSGTGANLRATAPLLGQNQDWTLLDNDPALLDAARDSLAEWADDAARTPDGARLLKDGKTITVRFLNRDIARNPGGTLPTGVDLVTASAFFDLVSPAFINELAAAVVHRKAAFHTVLTYDGTQTWTPPCAWDDEMVRAFNAHQKGDKGFGAAAGPCAPLLLRRAFEAAGYRTETGDSPWDLDQKDATLIGDLADGIAVAVAETGRIDVSRITVWRDAVRSDVRIGHGDILALPAA